MSMNKFMHSKNIYKTPINFNQLAIEFDEIRKASKIVSKFFFIVVVIIAKFLIFPHFFYRI